MCSSRPMFQLSCVVTISVLQCHSFSFTFKCLHVKVSLEIIMSKMNTLSTDNSILPTAELNQNASLA